jgi:hypothetical protein
MAKQPKPRVRRPEILEIPSITEKRFKRVTKTKKTINLAKLDHPVVVAKDLRRGSLISLATYLDKHGGIPDVEVAQALRLLIDGPASQIRHRIGIIRHPDLPPNSKPARSAKVRPPTAADWKIVEFCEDPEFKGVRKTSVVGNAMDKFGVEEHHVYDALKRVKADRKASINAENARLSLETTLIRRQTVLDDLRNQTSES